MPLHNSEVEYWTDGSCYQIGESLSAGYAIVEPQGMDFAIVKAEIIPQPASAQLAELVGLTEACLLAEGKKVTIYTALHIHIMFVICLGQYGKIEVLRKQMVLPYNIMRKS